MAGTLSELGFSGRRATKSITNAFSAGGVAASAAGGGGRIVASGALTAGTLKTLLTITGPGEMPFLSAFVADSTSRTIRLKVTVDGTVVFDATSSAITITFQGLVAVGSYTASNPNPAAVGSPIIFNQSLLVEVASSLTETDKVSISYLAHGL